MELGFATVNKQRSVEDAIDDGDESAVTNNGTQNYEKEIHRDNCGGVISGRFLLLKVFENELGEKGEERGCSIKSHELELMGDKPMKKSKYLALKSNSKGSKVVQIFESEEEILARGSEDGFDDEEMTYL
ncbi:hypothetical protein QL285_019789 [Trifolium repens]|nr:hypothetical protein QL285_019789 [Trifolium repens]